MRVRKGGTGDICVPFHQYVSSCVSATYVYSCVQELSLYRWRKSARVDFSRFNDEINLTTSILFDGLLPLFLNSFLVVQMFYVNNRKDKGRMSALCKDLRMTEQKRARVVCHWS